MEAANRDREFLYGTKSVLMKRAFLLQTDLSRESNLPAFLMFWEDLEWCGGYHTYIMKLRKGP